MARWWGGKAFLNLVPLPAFAGESPIREHYVADKSSNASTFRTPATLAGSMDHLLTNAWIGELL